MVNHFGYWIFGRDMLNVNLKTMKGNGISDIFLNYAAFSKHGETKVLNWIQEAKQHNIDVHIWMQCFYDGEWHNPVVADLSGKIKEAKKYANMNGVKGVHLDYLRYQGNAYKTNNADKAINNFVKKIRDENPNTFLSCAVMPENEAKKYYGQDIEALGKLVDAVVPMQYKGNYKQGTDWLANISKNFSSKATIWSGLQSYTSDDNTTPLSANELINDIKTCLNNGAKGVMLFRYGLSQNVKFPEQKVKIPTQLTVKKLVSASNKDYLLATLTDNNGKAITGVNIGFADNGVKYVKTDTGGKARYFPNKTIDGKYDFKIAFFGNDTYEASEKISYRLWVGKIPSQLSVKKMVSASNTDYLMAVLTDADNKPIPNVNVGFAYNGVTYVATDKEGRARYSLAKLQNGTYTIKVAFFGNSNYKPSDKIEFKYNNEPPKPTRKKYGHATEPCCDDRGQNTPFYCGPHALQEIFRNLTGIVVPQSTIAEWAGTTSSGSSHAGLETAVAKFNQKYDYNLQVTWKNFSEVGWNGIKEIVNSNDKDALVHNLYRRGTENEGGHYEVVNDVYDDTVNVQNSLGSRCRNDCYYGYIEYRTKSEFEYYINGISQKSVLIVTRG